MSFVSRLIDPNPPLTSAQVQQAVAAALQANAPSPIQKIQRGVITVPTGATDSGTVTILAVNMAKADLRFLGASGFGYVSQVHGTGRAYQYGVYGGAMIRLASSTTIEWTKGRDAGGNISYEVVESV